MEYQIQELLARHNDTVRTALELLEEFMSEEERQHDMVLKELCRQLLSVNPLHIKSHTQGAFWDVVCRVYKRLHDPEVEDPEYTFILDDGEAVIRCCFGEALLTMIITLIKPDFQRLLLSVNAIPHHIIAAFLQRAGPRRYLKECIFSCVEDRIDLFGFFRNGQLGQQTFELLLNEQYESDAQSCYETPQPEFDPKYAALCERDTPPSADLPSTERFLDALPVRSLDKLLSAGRSFASLQQSKFLAGLYTHVWSEVAELLPTVPTACSQNPKNCLCRRHLFSVRTLLDMVQLFVSEHMDTRTLVRPAARHLFGALEYQPLLAKLESIAADVKNYLRSEPCSMRLGARMLQHAALVEGHLHPQLEQSFATAANPEATAFVWQCMRVEDMPIDFLLMALDLQYAIPFWAFKLRCFLAGKSRSIHFAYAFPPGITLYDVELTLSTLSQTYSALAPGLFENCCTVALHDKIFIVCPTESMRNIRSLMLLTAVRTEHVLEKQMLSSDVFLRAFAPPPHQGTDIELYCAVAALVCFMDGPRAKLDRLATPDQPEAFALYRLLPEVAGLLVHSDLRTEGYPVLRSFLFPFSEHCMDFDGLECFVGILRTLPCPTASEAHLLALLARRLKSLRSGQFIRLVPIANVQGHRNSIPLQIYTLLFTHSAFADSHVRFAVLSSLGCGKRPSRKKMPVQVVPGSTQLAQPLFVHDYLEHIRPFWTPESVSTRLKACYAQLATQDCRGTTANWTATKLDGLAVQHYLHSSSAGRTQLHEIPPASIPHGLASLIRIYHSAEWFALEPVNGMGMFSPLASRTVTLHTGKILPLVFRKGQPPCHFENCFFLRVERSDWPRSPTRLSEIVLSPGDQPILDSVILRDLAVQFVKPWLIGTLSPAFKREFPNFSYLGSLQQRCDLDQ